MNAVGRQRSSSSHHQRQYSETFLDTNTSQDIGYYGGGGGYQGSRGYRNVQRSVNGGNELFSDPTTPPLSSRSSSQRKSGGEEYVSPSELSPGILDLHSLDTELLPQMPVPGVYDGYRGRSFDDSEPYISVNRQTFKDRGILENNLLKSFTVDKEKSSSVAKIKVVVRKRPLNKKETAKKEEDIITIEPGSNYLTVHETKLKVDLTEYMERHEFAFDAVLDEEVSNEEVTLSGDSGAHCSNHLSTNQSNLLCIWANRQVVNGFTICAEVVHVVVLLKIRSGKTYTMQPLPLKASQDILRLMHHTYRNQGFQLFVSFFEIYGGKLYDLLNERRKLCMREDGKQQVCIVGLQEFKVSNVDTIRDLIEKGNASRSIGTTGANEESSRSHAILQLVIKRSADGSESKPARVVGKLSFIDLAGSERGADTTDNDKQTRMEGAEINKSLLALKECIRALDSDQGHIPFRGSKLTEVLRDSFVGDSRTVMISCVSPSSGSCEHTLNTLRYADRVKSLSKGNNSKKDPFSSTLNIRASTTLPSTSVIPTSSTSESTIADYPNEHNRFGWSKQVEKETSVAYNMDHAPSGREDDFDYTEEFYETEKPLRKKNVKSDNGYNSIVEEKSRKADAQGKWKDMPDSNSFSHANDNLNALLKEEEDLVSAHRKQVEDTIDIVREEMKLLVEADQPGNQLDDYISKLNTILSQKATGILQLQNRLAHFQRRLNEHNVLVSSGH
ncbi:hypothetical protein GIB67_011119 [Kingdonia uniflora]|uniref:Kinesin-like protein n=1 Tax=Kingdonia uniflora TaxID=39325 RepID=A0A7J7PAH1_9MAGN|nr:hypothetical protein GIB67_011119 [Kingdonia uniflora]